MDDLEELELLLDDKRGCPIEDAVIKGEWKIRYCNIVRIHSHVSQLKNSCTSAMFIW